MIANLALHQLAIRQRAAQKAVSRAETPQAHALAVTEMNARLAPWLAAALRCGADISQIAPDQHEELQDEIHRQLERIEARHNGPQARKGDCPPAAAPERSGGSSREERTAEAVRISRSLVALRYCDLGEMCTVVAKARDASNPDGPHFAPLTQIAHHLGCPNPPRNGEVAAETADGGVSAQQKEAA